MNFVEILSNVMSNVCLYLIIFLVYVILTVIILPIPVEIGLFNPFIHPIILILILALGKGIGSLIVFTIGSKVRLYLKRLTNNFNITTKIVNHCENFVFKHGYVGLFAVLSTPLMPDSITLYLFSLLNPENAMKTSRFALINVLAGFTRGSIILGIMFVFEIKLV